MHEWPVISRCKICYTQIIWAVTVTGKKFTLNATPSLDGMLYAIPQAGKDGGLALDELPIAIGVRTDTPSVHEARDRGALKYVNHYCVLKREAY